MWRFFPFFFLSQYEIEVILCGVCLALVLSIEARMLRVVMQTLAVLSLHLC